jgi:hypothetical protein
METCENVKYTKQIGQYNMTLFKLAGSPVSSSYIENRFTVLQKLGQGADGIVLKVVDNITDNVVALKSIFFSEDIEIIFACKLYPTKIFTNCILIPINWSLVDKPPFIKYYEKVQCEQKKTISEMGLVYTMILLDGSFKDFVTYFYRIKYPEYYEDEEEGENEYNNIDLLTENDIRDIIFETYMVVYILHQNAIIHSDLHLGNLGYKKTIEQRIYKINNIPYIVKSKYMPIIYDFSRSIDLIEEKQQHNTPDAIQGVKERDLNKLANSLTIFNDYMDKWNTKFIEKIRTDFEFRPLLDKIFKPLTKRSIEEGIPTIFFSNIILK